MNLLYVNIAFARCLCVLFSNACTDNIKLLTGTVFYMVFDKWWFDINELQYRINCHIAKPFATTGYPGIDRCFIKIGTLKGLKTTDEGPGLK
jgi:hypothetical protein